jgi:hypothetical protein
MSPQSGLLCAREPAAPSIGMMVVLKEGVAEKLLENLTPSVATLPIAAAIGNNLIFDVIRFFWMCPRNSIVCPDRVIDSATVSKFQDPVWERLRERCQPICFPFFQVINMHHKSPS